MVSMSSERTAVDGFLILLMNRQGLIYFISILEAIAMSFFSVI